MSDSHRKSKNAEGRKSSANEPEPESTNVFPGRITRRSRLRPLQVHQPMDFEVIPEQPQPNPPVPIHRVTLADIGDIRQFTKPNIPINFERPKPILYNPSGSPGTLPKPHPRTRLPKLNWPKHSNRSDKSNKENIVPTLPELVPSVNLGTTSQIPASVVPSVSLGAIRKVPQKTPFLYKTYSSDDSDLSDQLEKKDVLPSPSTSSGTIPLIGCNTRQAPKASPTDAFGIPDQWYEPEPSESLRMTPEPWKKTLLLRKAGLSSLTPLPIIRPKPYLFYPDTSKSTGCLAKNIADQPREKLPSIFPKKSLDLLKPHTSSSTLSNVLDTGVSQEKVGSTSASPKYMIPFSSAAYSPIDELIGIPSVSTARSIARSMGVDPGSVTMELAESYYKTHTASNENLSWEEDGLPKEESDPKKEDDS